MQIFNKVKETGDISLTICQIFNIYIITIIVKIFTWDTPDDKRIYKHDEEKNEMIRNGRLKQSAKPRSKQDYYLKTERIDRLIINANLFNSLNFSKHNFVKPLYHEYTKHIAFQTNHHHLPIKNQPSSSKSPPLRPNINPNINHRFLVSCQKSRKNSIAPQIFCLHISQ